VIGKKGILEFVLPVLLAAAALTAVSCSRGDEKTAKRLLELESENYEAGRTSDARIAELEKDVAAYKKIVEEKVRASERLGSYYKLLALAYLDRAMYGQALEALDRAVEIYPEQAPLFLFRGVAAARMSKAVRDGTEKIALLDTAEAAYRRAIALDPASVAALYGLAILYSFELGRNGDALPLVEGILDREKNNVDALFLLARVHFALGRPEEAIAAYDRIIAIPEAGSRGDEARRNKRQILEGATR
jgi:tetratricopeptide (TPR) repeat protein